MYDRSSAATGVDEARLHIFARKQRPYDSIPPTQADIREHAKLKRAAYQVGVIWGQATCANPDIGSPPDWGWIKTEAMWKVCWTKLTLPPIKLSCQELTKWLCKKGCTRMRKCLRSELAYATVRVNSRTVRKTTVFQLVQYMCSNGQLSNIFYRFACGC